MQYACQRLFLMTPKVDITMNNREVYKSEISGLLDELVKILSLTLNQQQEYNIQEVSSIK